MAKHTLKILLCEQRKIFKLRLAILQRPKLCENCSFPQNFHTKNLGEIKAFYAMNGSSYVEYVRIQVFSDL